MVDKNMLNKICIDFYIREKKFHDLKFGARI